MDPSVTPLAALSFIVAPAMLTNACAIMGLSSSNRLAIATQRARDLARELESEGGLHSPDAMLRLDEMESAAERSEFIIRALRAFYFAIGAFGLATLLSLIGAVLESVDPLGMVRAVELLALGAGTLGFGGLVMGSVHLLRETRIAVRELDARSAGLRAKAEQFRRAAGS
jgi:Protein of unknown function (DUF2721)